MTLQSNYCILKKHVYVLHIDITCYSYTRMEDSVKNKIFTRKICASHKLEMRKEAAQEWRLL